MTNQDTHTYFYYDGRKLALQDFTFWLDTNHQEHYKATYKRQLIQATSFREWRSKLIQILDEEAMEVEVEVIR